MTTFLDVHAGTHSKEGDYTEITAARKRDISIVLLAAIDVLDRICNYDIGPAPALPASPEDYKAAFIKAMGTDRPTAVVETMTKKLAEGKILTMADDRSDFDEMLRITAQDMAVEIMRSWPDYAQEILRDLSRKAVLRHMMRP